MFYQQQMVQIQMNNNKNNNFNQKMSEPINKLNQQNYNYY